jgi:cysteine desulfurase
MKVYFDNAATTPLDQEVLEAMLPFMKEKYGNPSAIHSFGRETRAAIENARKTIAGLINASPGEIFFTSGGTEANNAAIRCAIEKLNLKHAISSVIEHHAVSHTLKDIEKKRGLKVSWVKLKKDGHIDLDNLEELLKSNERSLVSLMHANNEIGNILPLEEVSALCERYDAVLHSDTVQTMCHYVYDMQQVKLHFANCSAHKFHGPKGIGFLYLGESVKIDPFIIGGTQERNMRAGTENLYGIIGMAKAFEKAHENMEADHRHIQGLKTHMMNKLKDEISGVCFNGDLGKNSLYTVLSVSLPPMANGEMLLFNLDIAGIAASGGSACSSGSNKGSHVLEAIGCDMVRPSIRFSFSHQNTVEEVNYCIGKLKEFVLASKKSESVA